VNAHGVAKASIVFSIAAVVCRCGVRVHGRGAAALAAYRAHKALATSKYRPAARPPATITAIRIES
jgi:hypothetical protein